MSASELFNRWTVEGADPAYPDVKWLKLSSGGATMPRVIVGVSEDDLEELELMLSQRHLAEEPRPAHTLRMRLHAQLDQVLAAGVIAELDAEAMREAIGDVFEILNAVPDDVDPDGPMVGDWYASQVLAPIRERLDRLRRAPVSIHPLDIAEAWAADQ